MTDPEGLIARLREFEISDALGDGDFSVCPEAADTLSQMREALSDAEAELVMLHRAIREGDPLGELRIRTDDILAIVRTTLHPTTKIEKGAQ